MESWIVTKSGLHFDFINTTEEMLIIEDIAHALGNICRFGGHSYKHYSVAQHSVICSYLVKDQYKLCALMHDSTEAYIGDMVSPLKSLFPQFKEVEENLWKVIAKRYSLPEVIPEDVKYADLQMLKAEKRDIMPKTKPWNFLEEIQETSYHIDPWISEYATWRFLHRFYELGGF